MTPEERLGNMRLRKWLLFTIGLVAALVVVLISYAPYFSASQTDELGTRFMGLVHDYAEADIQTLRGQSELAEATDLGILSSALKGEVSDLTPQNGDPVRASFALGMAEAAIEGAQPVNERLGQETPMSEQAKTTYSAGLEHLALGVLHTVRLREAAAAFLGAWQAHMAAITPPNGPVSRLLRSWRADVTDSSEPDREAYMKPLADVARRSGEHLRRLFACLRKAVSFARDHDVPVPADAAEALKEAGIASSGSWPSTLPR